MVGFHLHINRMMEVKQNRTEQGSKEWWGKDRKRSEETTQGDEQERNASLGYSLRGYIKSSQFMISTLENGTFHCM